MKEKKMSIFIEWSTIPGITNGKFLPENMVSKIRKDLEKILPGLKNKNMTKISICLD